MARLAYRREPVWSRYIIEGTSDRWNNVSVIKVTDRRTRKERFELLSIPKEKPPVWRKKASVEGIVCMCVFFLW